MVVFRMGYKGRVHKLKERERKSNGMASRVCKGSGSLDGDHRYLLFGPIGRVADEER